MRPIPKIEDYTNSPKGITLHLTDMIIWAKDAKQEIKTLEKYSIAQEKGNQRNQQRIAALEVDNEALRLGFDGSSGSIKTNYKK